MVTETMTAPIGAGQAITLTLPAAARFLPSARVVAASLGADSGLSVDEIDDVRLGVNELVSLLVERAGPESRITLTMLADNGRVHIEGSLDGPAGAAELDELANRILTAVADSFELSAAGFRFTKAATAIGTS